MTKITQNMETGKNIFCPIDLHQKTMMAGIAIDRGEVTYYNLDTDEDSGVVHLVAMLHDLHDRNPGSKVWVSYEAGGCGFRLADILDDEGFSVSVLAPTHLPQSPKSRSNKTDKKDVKRILEVLRGHVLAGNDLPAVWIPSAELRDDREVVRRRLRLKDDLSMVKNQIHGLLRRYGIKKPEGIKSNWTKKHLRWLHSLDTVLLDGASRALKSLLRAVEFYMKEIVAVEQDMLSLSESDRYRVQVESLVQIQGIAVLTAMVFLTELGDLSRFPNRRTLGSYLGLAPRSWESGEQNDCKGHISKMGPSRVRKVLNQAAWSLVRWDPRWRDWFEERTPLVKGKRRGKKKMITAVMRHLGVYMWHVGLASA